MTSKLLTFANTIDATLPMGLHIQTRDLKHCSELTANNINQTGLLVEIVELDYTGLVL